MKAFVVSIFLAISGFFGFNKQPQVALPTPTIEPSPTVYIEVIISPSIIPTKVPSPKPTLSIPKTSINEEILKKFFGITDVKQISVILKNPDEIRAYEREFYQKFLTYPIPRLTIANNTQLIGMPSKDGVKVCNGSQLKKLYDEITPIEKQAYFEKMDYDCHHNSSKQETVECQEWRRINDVNRVEPTKGSLDEQIAAYTKKISEYANKKNVYDDLLVKYCQN